MNRYRLEGRQLELHALKATQNQLAAATQRQRQRRREVTRQLERRQQHLRHLLTRHHCVANTHHFYPGSPRRTTVSGNCPPPAAPFALRASAESTE